MDKEFIRIYGNSGYLLRKNNLDTKSRVAMLAAVYYSFTRDKEPVPFDKFYDLSLEKTDQKLEKSSFKAFITQLRKELSTDDELVVEEDSGFICTDYLIKKMEAVENEFPQL